MAKFLIEVKHDATEAACNEAIRVFANTGSHFLTHADWGCLDGEHKAWLLVDVEDREQARDIIPPAYRRLARVIQLTKFSVSADNAIKPGHTF